jgi:hypothetical protein
MTNAKYFGILTSLNLLDHIDAFLNSSSHRLFA